MQQCTDQEHNCSVGSNLETVCKLWSQHLNHHDRYCGFPQELRHGSAKSQESRCDHLIRLECIRFKILERLSDVMKRWGLLPRFLREGIGDYREDKDVDLLESIGMEVYGGLVHKHMF